MTFCLGKGPGHVKKNLLNWPQVRTGPVWETCAHLQQGGKPALTGRVWRARPSLRVLLLQPVVPSSPGSGVCVCLPHLWSAAFARNDS